MAPLITVSYMHLLEDSKALVLVIGKNLPIPNSSVLWTDSAVKLYSSQGKTMTRSKKCKIGEKEINARKCEGGRKKKQQAILNAFSTFFLIPAFISQDSIP